MAAAVKATPSGVCFILLELLLAAGFVMFLSAAVFTKPNFGNITGMLCCAVLAVLCVKRTAFAAFIKRLCSSTAGRAAVAAVSAVILIGIITAAVISVLMLLSMNRLPEAPAPVIVLGCRVKESGPSLMLQKRIDAAYEYMSENESVICIASGGKGSDEPVSEAQSIKDGLVKKGISPDRIILEDKSENTFQNIRNSIEILDKLETERRAVIVTSEFHQLRAKMIASKQGLECYSKSSPTYLPLLPSYWIREWFGVLHELIVGRK